MHSFLTAHFLPFAPGTPSCISASPPAPCAPERTRPQRKRERAYEMPGGLSRHVRATEPERNSAEGNTSAPPGWILARVLAQHDEAATIGRIAAREGRFSPHRHLPCTRCPPKLLKAIREEDGAVAPRAVIATTGKEGMRTFHPDVVGIKVVGLSPLDAVPLEALEELLCEREVAVVWVEDVNIRRTEPRSLPHLPCQAGDRFLMLLQRGHGAPASAIVLGMVQDVDRLLPQVLGPLSGGEDEGRTRIDRPVTIIDHQRFLDHAPVQILLTGELMGLVQRVVAPGGPQAVAAQIQTEGGQPVMGRAVFFAVLLEDDEIVEHRAALITPRQGKGALPGGLLLDILGVVVPVPACEVDHRVPHQGGLAYTITDGLSGQAHHRADVGRIGFDVLYALEPQLPLHPLR